MFLATRPAALLALAALGGSLAVSPALAQANRKPAPAPAQTAPAAPAPTQNQGAAAQPQQTGPMVVAVKSEPSQADWTKVCGKDPSGGAEICYTTRDFVSDQGQPVLAVAVYDMKGPQNVKVVRFLMPLGLLLQPGVRFAVDQGGATPGRYAVCFPNGCFAEAPGIKDEVVAAMKKGTTLNISVQNQMQREVTFAVPLTGFGKAFDGAPIDPKVLEEQQKKLQEELEKRSEEMRKKLETNAGGSAPATPAPAAKP